MLEVLEGVLVGDLYQEEGEEELRERVAIVLSEEGEEMGALVLEGEEGEMPVVLGEVVGGGRVALEGLVEVGALVEPAL